MLDLPEEELTAYAEQIKERFKNPFVRHELSSIALNSVSKFQARLLPILLRFYDTKKSLPLGITAALAALIVSYLEETGNDDAEVLALFAEAKELPAEEQVAFLLAQTKLWGQDLTEVAPLVDTVNELVKKIHEVGTRAVIKEIHQQAE